MRLNNHFLKVLLSLTVVCATGLTLMELNVLQASDAQQLLARLNDGSQPVVPRDRTDTKFEAGLATGKLQPVTESIGNVRFVGGEPRSSAGKDANGVDLDFGIFINTGTLTIEYEGTVAETWRIFTTGLPGLTFDPDSGIFFGSGIQYSTMTLDRTGLPLGEYIGEKTLDWGFLGDETLVIRFEVNDAFIPQTVFPPGGTVLDPGVDQYFNSTTRVALWSQNTADLFFDILDDEGNLLESSGIPLTMAGAYDFLGEDNAVIPFTTSFVYTETGFYISGTFPPEAYFQQPYLVNKGCVCPLQGDINGDAVIDNLDLNSTIDILFFGMPDVTDPSCVGSRSDLNCDGVSDNLDLNMMIDYLFFGGTSPCDPCI